MMAKQNKISFIVATKDEINSLRKISTEKLILWIVGKSKEQNKNLSPEEIVIECWLINPEKHSMRGFNQFPDSQTVQKRIGEMKGKKGLLQGSEMSGYSLTEISKSIYADLKQLIKHNRIENIKGHSIADRTIRSMDEAPYKSLKKTPAYVKYMDRRIDEIVETDFLYFYGINWHSKKSFIQSRIKNTDAVVSFFGKKDETLKKVHSFLNKKFENVRIHLLSNK